MRPTIAVSVALGLLVPAAACTTDSGTTTATQKAASLFSTSVTELQIEIDYAPNAAPYTGNEGPFGDPWDILRINLDGLFAAAPKTFVVDDALAKMDALDAAPGGPDYDTSEILAIAQTGRSAVDHDAVRGFYVLFLDGYFEQDGVRQDQVLGVSLGTTGVLAMFKPVIESTGLLVRKRVEQTTLVHELGHAFGLVNNGLALVDAAHQDGAHGAHCANPKCIMYWENMRGSSIAAYVAEQLGAASKVLFDEDCLDDAFAASQAK